MNPRIVVENLGIRFDLDRQRRPVTPTLTRLRRRCTTHWVLRNVGLEIESGAGVALIGANGMGKSTLLRAFAGVLIADEGRVTVEGKIGSLLSIDGGLMTGLTGRENAMLLGLLSGIPRAVVREAIPSIEERAGLENAFDRPVSTYSQGMRARLGFSVIERSNPDVLLLDEIHEAIDETFRARLESRVKQVRSGGGIVVAASHDHAMLSRLCDSAFLLDRDGVHALETFDESTGLLAPERVTA